MIRGPRSLAGLTAKAVCIPNAAVIPSKTKKIARGTSPDGGGLFVLSVAANMTSTRINVPINSSKKQFAAGRYSSCRIH
jgi:hypothetical protein